jgi:hypothetical protein
MYRIKYELTDVFATGSIPDLSDLLFDERFERVR